MTRRVSTIRRKYITTEQLRRNLAEVEEHARIRAEREAAADIAANVQLDSATPVTDAMVADLIRDIAQLVIDTSRA